MSTTLTADSWLTDWAAWHRDREASARAPLGTASLTGTHWLSETPEQIDGLPGTWTASGGRVEGPGVALAAGEQALLGEVKLLVIERQGRLALRVFDPAAPTRRSLAGIDVFPPDPDWVVEGWFEASGSPEGLATDHVDGSVSDDRVAGTLRLRVHGNDVAATVFEHGPGEGQLRFSDTAFSAGKGFRFLRVEVPRESGPVVIDFNRAVLPPCAFTDHYLCPLPPADSRFSFAVPAGERALRTRPVTA